MSVRYFAVSAALTVVGTACNDDNTACDPEAPNTICTIVGSGAQGMKGDGGLAINAELYITQDTAIGPDGKLWLLDFNNYLVRTVDDRGIIETVVGNGQIGDSPTTEMASNTPALQALNNHTPDLLFHGDYLYLASWHNSRIKRIRLSDMTIENYAGAGKRTKYDGDGGPAMLAAFDLPSSIAIDLTGNLVVMDQANQVIRRIEDDGNGTTTISTIAGTCVVEDTPCAAGEQPAACPGSEKLACGDIETECAKACTLGYGGDGGPPLALRMAQPIDQAADPAGRLQYNAAGDLVFADTSNDRVRMISASGVVSTIAGTGVQGYSGDGGPATAAQINHPIDVAWAPDNTLYFTEVGNNCVRKIDPAGIISTVVGQCGTEHGFSGDGGPPLEAKLNRPYGIDLVGNKLYISDSFNNRIRVVNLPE